MPSAATLSSPQQGQNASPAANGKNAPLPVVPFVRASYENRQDTGWQVSKTLTAATQPLTPSLSVPAYGYLRALVLTVTATGAGGATSGVLSADGPWNVLQDISLTEPNGAPIYQVSSGFSAYLIQKWGAYRGRGVDDPKDSTYYSADAAGNFTFSLRIPVEIIPREALGALPNQNDTAQFKFKASLAADSAVYSTLPTTLPTVTVSAYMECWDQPAQDVAGMTNQLVPPAMNTTQFWSESTFNIGSGTQQIKLDRLGNYIRNLIFIVKDAGNGTRLTGDANWPDPITFYLDARPMDDLPKGIWKEQMYKRGLLSSSTSGNPKGPNDGVFVYDFTHDFDGVLGNELRNRWLGTLGSERLEFRGSFAAASTVTVLTNDVAIAGSVWS